MTKNDHKNQQHCLYLPPTRKCGARVHAPIPVDDTPRLDNKRKKRIQLIIGSLLYYAREIDLTMLTSLSSKVREQAQLTEGTEDRTKQLLDYCATDPSTILQYCASTIILNIHIDASYLSEANAKSSACGKYFLGSLLVPNEPIQLNGCVFIM